MKKKFTISDKANFITDSNRNKSVIIKNEDNKELSFKELHKYILDLSVIPVFDKKYGLPRIYQISRNTFEENYILQKDKTNLNNYINILTLDYDSNVSRETVEKELSNFEYISYYSFNHGVKEGNRFRIILNLDANVEIKNINSRLKKDILNEFKFEGDLPDSASIKNGWMALPALYEGHRNPEVKYNGGFRYSLLNIINKISLEKNINNTMKHKINEKVDDSKEFNAERQQNTFDELKDELFNASVGNRHNAVVNFISKCSLIGLDASEIRTVIYDYEENEEKISMWIDLIEEWTADRKTISYYYRYEYKLFKGEYFLYDNVKDLFYDSITDKWLKGKPRSKKQDYLKLKDKSKLYEALVIRFANNYILAKKVFDFVLRIKEQYDENDKISLKQYEQPINRGVAFTKKISKIVMFDIFKFREIEKEDGIIELKSNTILGSVTDIFSISEELNDKCIDDQTKLLSVLKELVWVRRESFEFNIGDKKVKQWKTYFSPKDTLLKLWDF